MKRTEKLIVILTISAGLLLILAAILLKLNKIETGLQGPVCK